MSKYCIICPVCGCKELQEVDYQTFECDECQYEFSLEEADVESDDEE